MIDSNTEDDIDFVVVNVDETKVFASANSAEHDGFGGFDQTGNVVHQTGFEVEEQVAVADRVDTTIGIREQLRAVQGKVLGGIVRRNVGWRRQGIEVGFLAG